MITMSEKHGNRNADGNESEHHPCHWIGETIAICSQGDQFSKSKELQNKGYDRYNTHREQWQTKKTTVEKESFIRRDPAAAFLIEDKTLN
jgi:hypothetical protein